MSYSRGNRKKSLLNSIFQNDIVDNGQLSKSKDYAERIRAYQIKYGLRDEELKPEELKKDPQNPAEKKKGKKSGKQRTHKPKAKGKARTRSNFDDEIRRGPNMARYLSLPADHYYRKAEMEDEEHHTHQKEIHEKDNETHTSGGIKKESGRGPKLKDDFELKIVDLGNACWKHHHFSTEIQTRQYRSPEVIIGVNYNETADMWSFACTIFEMLTGDFLFEPKKGPNFDKDDDHLAQVFNVICKLIPNRSSNWLQEFQRSLHCLELSLR